jgi:hypothetical protein
MEKFFEVYILWTLNQEEIRNLNRQINKEINSGIESLPSKKSPGPGDFMTEF